jgi:hypothetical protein
VYVAWMSKHTETELEPKEKVVLIKKVNEKSVDGNDRDKAPNNSDNNGNEYVSGNDNTNVSNPHTRQKTLTKNTSCFRNSDDTLMRM